jgi:flagellar biosynthetic protein FliQ
VTPELTVEIISGAFMAAFWLSAPLLLIGFVIGTVINLIQILTSMQDSVFSTVPRLAAFLFGFLLMLPWLVSQMMTYTQGLFQDLWRFSG